MLTEALDTVGPFRVTGVLGWGTTGTVYRGLTVEGLVSAIKVFRPGFEGAWRTEVAMLTRLARRNAPGIARIIEVGVEPAHWYSMDLVGGEPLRDVLRRHWQPSEAPCDGTARVGTRDIERSTSEGQLGASLQSAAVAGPEAVSGIGPLLGSMASIAATLSHLHAAGVTHGDLKPENILLGGDREPVLIDFGSASLGMADDMRESGVAMDQPWMTPGYTAPEVLKGQAATPRSDLYAFGCILFEILTGQPPLAPMPCLRWPAFSQLAAPEAVRKLIEGLLQPDPRDRLHFAADLAEVLADVNGSGASGRARAPLPRSLHRPNYVGRQSALQSIVDAVGDLSRGGGGSVIVEGEGGSGKTRLLAEALRANPVPGLRSIVARRDAHAALASVSLTGALKAALNATVAESPPPEFVTSLLSVDAQEPGATPSPRPAELHRALLWLAEQRPLLLIVDDLQDADDVTRALVEAVTGPPAMRGVLALAAIRGDCGDPALRELARCAGRRVTLTRLSEGELRLLLRDAMAAAQLPAGLARLVYDRSAGNPRYALEFARWTIDAAFVKRCGSGWVHAKRQERAEDELPADLEALLERRCQELSRGARCALQMLAILGGDQELGQVADLCRAAFGLDEAAAVNAVDELLQSGAARLRGSSRCELEHPLLESYAYSCLTLSERQRLHCHVAAAMEDAVRQTGERELGDQLGKHWLDAGRPERALEHLIVAGHLHAGQRRLRRAERAFSRALTCVQTLVASEPGKAPELGTQEMEVYEALVDLRSQLGWIDEAINALIVLVDVAESPLVAARALRRWGELHMARNEHGAAEEKFLRAMERLEGVRDPLAMRLHEHHAVQLCRVENAYFQREVARMRALIAGLQSLSTGEANVVQRATLALCKANLSFQESGFRYTPAAGAQWLEAIELLERGELQQERLAFARVDLGTALLFGGADEWSSAYHHLSEGIRVADRLSDIKLLARAFAYSSTALRRLRRVAEVEREARRCVDIAEACHFETYVGVGWGNLAWAAVMRGENARGLALSQRALSLWGGGEHCYPLQWIALFPWLAAGDTGDPAALVAALRLLLDPGQQPLPAELADVLRDCISAPDGERADRLKQALLIAVRLGYV